MTTNIARRCIFRPYRHLAHAKCRIRFILTMWDNVGYDAAGKIRIRYELAIKDDNGKRVLFSGSDFATPHASDSDATVAGLMGFLTLRRGDTDADYFDGYTDAQRAFCSEHAEALAVAVGYRFERS